MQQTGTAERRNTIMRFFRLPASVRAQLYGETKPRGAPAVRLRRRRRYGRHQQPPAAVRLSLAAGTKTFLFRFREKEHEMPSLQNGPESRFIFRLMSCAAAALLTSGMWIATWFQRRRDYRRTLNELHALSEQDLRELRISGADFNAIARAEAKRVHELRRGSQLSNRSLARRLRSASEDSRPANR
jgi:hypothetical protein